MIFYHHKHGLPFRRSSPIFMRRRFQRTLILLTLDGDIALNPVQRVTEERQPKYPCTVREKGVTARIQQWTVIFVKDGRTPNAQDLSQMIFTKSDQE